MSSRKLKSKAAAPEEAPKDAGHPEYGVVRVPNIRIVGPRVLVLPKPRKEKVTEAGIVIPEHAQEQVQEGVVLIVGDGTLVDGAPWAAPENKLTPGVSDMSTARPLRLPSSVEPGDCIIYARYAGIDLELGDDKYLIISEADIRAVLTYKGKAFSVIE